MRKIVYIYIWLGGFQKHAQIYAQVESCGLILGHLIIELPFYNHKQGMLGHFVVFINLRKVKVI